MKTHYVGNLQCFCEDAALDHENKALDHKGDMKKLEKIVVKDKDGNVEW